MRLASHKRSLPLLHTESAQQNRVALAPRVLLYADLLPPEDRALLESVFLHHTPVTLITCAMGLPPRAVRRMRRRIRRLAERTLTPKFRAVARAILHRSLPSTHAAVARHRFLHARSLRKTAEHLNLPLHVVRRAAGEVELLLTLIPTQPLALAA